MSENPFAWRIDPDDGAYVARREGFAGFARDSDDGGRSEFVNWSMWKRWFHTNTGIGNSMNMWWPSRKGPYMALVTCDRCGLPFEIPTGLTMSLIPANGRPIPDPDEIKWTGGPCTHCKAEGVIATGSPVTYRFADSAGNTVISTSVEAGAAEWAELTVNRPGVSGDFLV